MRYANLSASLLLLGLAALDLRAQCATTFATGDAIAGTEDLARAILEWDPDGSGPLPARIIVAGDFSWIANIPANGIASLDPATGQWSSMAGGVDNFGGTGRAFHLDVLASGELVVAGQFTGAGGVPANNIATWNGQTWSALGTGLQNVSDIAIAPNGDLIAAADVGNNDQVTRWNGTSWVTIVGTSFGGIDAIAPLANGDLIVAGFFTPIGSSTTERIARWDGTNWSPLGIGLPNYNIEDVIELASGDILAAGNGTGIQGNNISRYDGSTWQPLGNGFDSTVLTVAQLSNGDIIAVGTFRASGPTAVNGIARWNGSSWSEVAGGIDALSGYIQHVSQTNAGEILAAGQFATIGQIGVNNIARFDGTSWQALAAGTNSNVTCVAATGDDTYVVGGLFTAIGGVPANRVAQWNGSSWSALGSGCNGVVSAIVQMPNGDIIAGGQFDAAGGQPANAIARWDGSTWSPLGNGLQFTSLTRVSTMSVLPDGRLVVGGSFGAAGNVVANNLAIWDGLNWAPLGQGSSSNVVTVLALPNGDIVADGQYIGSTFYRLARWDGTAWQQFGSSPVTAQMRRLTLLANGDVVANGLFSQIGGVTARNIARWDGSQWLPFGSGLSGSSYDSLTLPNGDLLATGFFTSAGGAPAMRIGRWDGSGWSAFGNGLEGGIGRDVAALPNGDLIVVGDFTSADDQPSAHVARLTTSCPAEATAFGSGCIGTGGLNELTAKTLPWLDARYELRGTGMPSNAFVVGVRGLTTTQQALGALLPQGQAGCDLLVTPDLLDIYAPSNGEISASFDIPNNTALIGQVLHHQLVPFTFGPNGSLISLTSSNALTLTIGTF